MPRLPVSQVPKSGYLRLCGNIAPSGPRIKAKEHLPGPCPNSTVTFIFRALGVASETLKQEKKTLWRTVAVCVYFTTMGSELPRGEGPPAVSANCCEGPWASTKASALPGTFPVRMLEPGVQGYVPKSFNISQPPSLCHFFLHF